VYDIITDRIIAQLENQVDPWHKTLEGLAPPAPRRISRAVNPIAVSTCSFSAWPPSRPRIGSPTAKPPSAAAASKKGEHGYPVVFWKIFERTEKDDNNNERNQALAVPALLHPL